MTVCELRSGMRVALPPGVAGARGGKVLALASSRFPQQSPTHHHTGRSVQVHAKGLKPPSPIFSRKLSVSPSSRKPHYVCSVFRRRLERQHRFLQSCVSASLFRIFCHHVCFIFPIGLTDYVVLWYFNRRYCVACIYE